MRAGLRTLLLGVAGATAVLGAAAQGASAPRPPPCQAAEHRQFDFWIGRWEVYTHDGRKAGDNLIEPVLGGCALRETWSGRGGFAGISLNSYDAADGRWHQSWVDNQGTRLQLAGGRLGDAMVLSSATPLRGQPGVMQHQRITWTPLAGGHVRQLWEASDDNGKSWRVEFDGRYERAR